MHICMYVYCIYTHLREYTPLAHCPLVQRQEEDTLLNKQ